MSQLNQIYNLMLHLSKIYFNINLPSTLRLTSDVFLLGLPLKDWYTRTFTIMRAACHAYFIFHYSVTPIIFGCIQILKPFLAQCSAAGSTSFSFLFHDDTC